LFPVTKSYIPELDSYVSIVKRAFDNAWLTNRGELVQELEHNISDYLNLKNTQLFCLNNGTIPIQIALKLLADGGEVITTPFSYVATTAAIVWENCTPVFVDINEDYLTIDESKIEEAITDKTTCILATHVYGNPCNIEAIDKIAKKHNLKVIYDAAHCFGVVYKGKSIFEYGDVSTCSFHATKIFHSGEGGAIFCKNQDLYSKLFYSHNFGHKGTNEFNGLGINAKMSELNAAMGLAVLPKLNDILQGRKNIVEEYTSALSNSNIKLINIRKETQWNYSYFPVLFQVENTLLKVMNALEEADIFARRYFFPTLNNLPYINDEKTYPVAEEVATQVLCLPLYYDIKQDDVLKICNIIKNNI
jgi:dTDP-4-amino-4,6-dideoxygalactose transaminase